MIGKCSTLHILILLGVASIIWYFFSRRQENFWHGRRGPWRPWFRGRGWSPYVSNIYYPVIEQETRSGYPMEKYGSLSSIGGNVTLVLYRQKVPDSINEYQYYAQDPNGGYIPLPNSYYGSGDVVNVPNQQYEFKVSVL